MPNFSLNGIRLDSVVTVTGSIRKRIEDEWDRYGGDRKQLERIRKTIGLNERVVAEDGVTAADLCQAACERLIWRRGLDKGAIDALICVTQTPDFFQPCTAACLHGRLRLPIDCAAFDVNLGCSGYVYGLWLASLMIQGGGCDGVLLAVGDTLSRCLNPRDRAVAPLFGDAGSATLIRREKEGARAWFKLHTDGRGAGHIIIPAGAFRQPVSKTTSVEEVDDDGNARSAENLQMNGAEVFSFSLRVVPGAVRDLLAFAHKNLDEVDYFVFHQANRYILSNVARRLKVSWDRVPWRSIEQFGNLSSASIPGAICYELRDTVVSSRQSLLLAGFGVGFSWAVACLDVQLKLCELFTYEEAREVCSG